MPMNDQKREVWRRIGRSLKDIVPTVSGLLGGPLVGAGAKIVVEAIGGKEDEPEEIEARLSELAPEQLVEMKRADVEWKTKLADVEINEQIQLTERLKLDNATNSKWIQFLRPAFAYSYLFVGVYLVLSGWHGWFIDGDDLSTLQERVFSFTENTSKAVIGFYFGSRGVEKVAAIVGNRFGGNPAPLSVNAPILEALIKKLRNK